MSTLSRVPLRKRRHGTFKKTNPKLTCQRLFYLKRGHIGWKHIQNIFIWAGSFFVCLSLKLLRNFPLCLGPCIPTYCLMLLSAIAIVMNSSWSLLPLSCMSTTFLSPAEPQSLALALMLTAVRCKI